MATLINTKLGSNRGRSRIFLEGTKLAREGYVPGGRFDIIADGEKRLVLKMAEQGRYKISKRTRNGRTHPIIDINRAELADIFAGVEMLRCMVAKGKIIITAHFQEKRVNDRAERLMRKLEEGEPLRVGSLFHGAGTLDRALHDGFAKAGINTKTGVAVELESKYLDASLANNPDIWDQHSIPMQTPIQALDLRGTTMEMDIVAGGIPCTGASRSGISANHIQYAEEHEAAGALFFNFLSFIQAVNPAIVIAENVPEYANTAGMAVVRSVLGSLGYEVQERIMCGNAYGTLEKRRRLCVVAISKGLEGVFDINQIDPLCAKPATVGDILEPFDSVPAETWKTYDYLAKKEARDLAAGKGFKRQQVTADATSVATITRGYSKVRSTDPHLLHPTDPTLSRLFTPVEHARLKGVPEDLIEGLSATTAHEVLGQGVIFPLFAAVARSIGIAIKHASGLSPAKPRSLLAA